MIDLEFGQIVRVNYTTDLFFLCLVRDGVDLWLFPLDEEVAAGRAKVPFDPEPSRMRQVLFKDLRHIEVLHSPKPEERGVAKYYKLLPNLIVDIVFRFCRHLTVRFRVVNLEEDKISLVLIDPGMLATLPPSYASKLYFVDFGFRGNNPAFDIAMISVRDPAATLLVPQLYHSSGASSSESPSSLETTTTTTDMVSAPSSSSSLQKVDRAETEEQCIASTRQLVQPLSSIYVVPVLRSKKPSERVEEDCRQFAAPGVPSLTRVNRKWVLHPCPDLRTQVDVKYLVLPWIALQMLLPVGGTEPCFFPWSRRLVHSLTCDRISMMDWMRAAIRLDLQEEQQFVGKVRDVDRIIARHPVVAKETVSFSELFWWKMQRFIRSFQSTREFLLDSKGRARLESEAARNMQIWRTTLSIFEHYVMPLWKKKSNKARSQSQSSLIAEGSDHPWTGIDKRQDAVLTISRRASPMERLRLFRTRYSFLAYLTQTTFAGTEDISTAIASLLRKRKREEAAATTTTTNYVVSTTSFLSASASAFVPPVSVTLLNAKVLAKEFENEAEAKKSAGKNDDGKEVFDAHLDDLNYRWLDHFRQIEAQVSPSQFVEYLSAVLREQALPPIEPVELIPLLAEWLAYRRRPVLPGHFAFIKSTRRFMVWSGKEWTRPHFDVDPTVFHNCYSIAPSSYVSSQGTSRGNEKEGVNGSYEKWLAVETRVMRKEYLDLTQRNLWTPQPPWLAEQSLDEKTATAIAYLRAESILLFRNQLLKMQTIVTTLAAAEGLKEETGKGGRRTRTRAIKAEESLRRLDDLKQQLLDARHNGVDEWTILHAHAEWLGNNKWTLRRSDGLEFEWTPTSFSPSEAPTTQSVQKTTTSTTTEETEWMFAEFSGFLSMVSPETPLGRAASKFEFHSAWHYCWRATPFCDLAHTFFQAHYRPMLTAPFSRESKRTAWFVWLLILYFMVFRHAETRDQLFIPVFAACGYPYHNNRPEKLVQEHSMPNLIQGFFAPFSVLVPTIDDLRQSPLLETLWLLLHSTPTSSSSASSTSSSSSPTGLVQRGPPLRVEFTSLQESVSALQLRLHQEYRSLLETGGWMDGFEFEQFQRFAPEEQDMSARVVRYVQAKCSAWPVEWYQVLQSLHGMFEDQSVSHTEMGIYARRRLSELVRSDARASKDLRSWWKTRLSQMEGWLSAWESERTEQSVESAKWTASWWNDSASSSVYSWRGGSLDMVRKIVARYLKSMYLLSVVSFASRSHVVSTSSFG